MGLALIGVGLAAIWDVRWLVTAALVFGGEELYECSMALALIRHAEDEHRREVAERADASLVDALGVA